MSKVFAYKNLAINANNPTNHSSPKLCVSTNVKPNLLAPTYKQFHELALNGIFKKINRVKI
jgi:hypothetical protein